MHSQKRIRDYGISIGDLKTGPLNAITDVKGVQVGHSTIDQGSIKTGVTVIFPHKNNLFQNKVVAATHVINGFGKSVGLMQIEELGQLETPIALTNTLNVGIVSDAIIQYMLDDNDDICETTGSVNPVVCECNDMILNEIRKRSVEKKHVFEAIENASYEFLEGDVGAGKGMICYSYKGGIGSSSRIVEIEDQKYTIGVLVLSNFGRKQDLTINMKQHKELPKDTSVDKGSIIFIVATDVPMTSRQLKRVIKRVEVGLHRTGSFMSNGSGEVAIGFTTANKVKHNEKKATVKMEVFNESYIDILFRAVANASEEAILNSLITSNTCTGYKNRTIKSLKEEIDYYL